MAKLKLEQKESNAVPMVMEACLKRVKDKGLKKITRANVDYVLREKGLILSKPCKEIVYNRLKELLEMRLGDKD